ncbi:MAG: sulfatase activating formylglycine-generating enzyme [Alteromonadaceae bacterium]
MASLKKEAQMTLNKFLLTLYFSTTSYQLYAGETIKPIEPIMVAIPAGSFAMGDISEKDSQPIHNVNISEFSLGKYEITIKEFRRFVEATGYEMPTQCIHQLNGWFNYGATAGSWDNNSLTSNDFQPVNCIGWKAANAYTHWLAKETGRTYRLPSESEWEYAAKAGTKTKFYFGDDVDQTLVCHYENTADLAGENILQRDANTSYVNFFNGKSNCVDHSAYSSIVGMYQANSFGLHDMVSNVVEYIADCYQDSYKNSPSNGDALIDDVCEYRVSRGGSWHWNTFSTSQRGLLKEDFVGGVEGFRVALDGNVPTISSNTKLFSKQLQTAQKNEQHRRDAVLPYPAKVTHLSISQANGLVTLTWDKSVQEGIDSYRIYRNAGIGGSFKLMASNLVETTFKDANVDGLKYEYTVVAVRRHQQSDYSDVVTTEAPIGQVPGRIEAEGAVKIAGAGVTRTSDLDGKYNLTGFGGISNTAEITYQIDVEKSGAYSLSYRVAAPRDTKGFSVLVDGKEIIIAKIVKTGGYNEWSTQQAGTLNLKKGKITLVIKSLDDNWKINWLAFKLI